MDIHILSKIFVYCDVETTRWPLVSRWLFRFYWNDFAQFKLDFFYPSYKQTLAPCFFPQKSNNPTNFYKFLVIYDALFKGIFPNVPLKNIRKCFSNGCLSFEYLYWDHTPLGLDDKALFKKFCGALFTLPDEYKKTINALEIRAIFGCVNFDPLIEFARHNSYLTSIHFTTVRGKMLDLFETTKNLKVLDLYLPGHGRRSTSALIVSCDFSHPLIEKFYIRIKNSDGHKFYLPRLRKLIIVDSHVENFHNLFPLSGGVEWIKSRKIFYKKSLPGLKHVDIDSKSLSRSHLNVDVKSIQITSYDSDFINAAKMANLTYGNIRKLRINSHFSSLTTFWPWDCLKKIHIINLTMDEVTFFRLMDSTEELSLSFVKIIDSGDCVYGIKRPQLLQKLVFAFNNFSHNIKWDKLSNFTNLEYFYLEGDELPEAFYLSNIDFFEKLELRELCLRPYYSYPQDLLLRFLALDALSYINFMISIEDLIKIVPLTKKSHIKNFGIHIDFKVGNKISHNLHMAHFDQFLSSFSRRGTKLFLNYWVLKEQKNDVKKIVEKFEEIFEILGIDFHS